MSIFDLRGAVAILSTATITVKRPATTVYISGGIAQAETFTTFSVTACSVQPGRARDLEKAPEGTRSHEVAVIFSPIELQNRDRVTVPGRGDFEVYNNDAWSESGNYCRAVARQLDPSEPRP